MQQKFHTQNVPAMESSEAQNGQDSAPGSCPLPPACPAPSLIYVQQICCTLQSMHPAAGHRTRSQPVTVAPLACLAMWMELSPMQQPTSSTVLPSNTPSPA